MDVSAARWDAIDLTSALVGGTHGVADLLLPPVLDPLDATPGRIDVPTVVAGLRHIDASAEPALVFSHLAAVCVPSVCDDIVIDLMENDQGYRIRRPAGAAHLPRPVQGPILQVIGPDAGPTLGLHTVTAAINSLESESAGPAFSGTLVCTWRDGYLPVAADASLIGLLVDHAVALIQRERLTGKYAALKGRTEKLQDQLVRDRRIASAVGVAMALHHVDQSGAMDLLVRIAGRTGRGLEDVAASVMDTWNLPPLGVEAAD